MMRRTKAMTKINKQQATNALERIKSALRAGKEDKAVELVQQIFAAGFQHGVDSFFKGGPDDEL